jgi:hypothetical protein
LLLVGRVLKSCTVGSLFSLLLSCCFVVLFVAVVVVVVARCFVLLAVVGGVCEKIGAQQ